MAPATQETATRETATRETATRETATHETATHESVGAFVRARRRARGLSQRDLARLAGVGQRFVCELERDKRTLRLDAVARVLAVFGARVTAAEDPCAAAWQAPSVTAEPARAWPDLFQDWIASVLRALRREPGAAWRVDPDEQPLAERAVREGLLCWLPGFADAVTLPARPEPRAAAPAERAA